MHPSHHPSEMHPTKIVCVGRNYAAHAREMGNDVPERPLLFLKPVSSLLRSGQAILLPPDSERVEHEAEIGVVIGRKARHVSVTEAMSCVAGFAALNDVTARDLQRLDVQFNRAKGYDTFCPISEHGPAPGNDWRSLEVICRVNDVQHQHGRATDMVFGIPQLIAYITRVMTLEPGDIIATGSPEGVSPLLDGDVCEIELVGVGTVTNPVRRDPAALPLDGGHK